MLCAERAGRAQPLHLTTVAVFVLPWPVSHGYTTGSALMHHRGFWCNQQLAKDRYRFPVPLQKNLLDWSLSQAEDKRDECGTAEVCAFAVRASGWDPWEGRAPG